MHRLPRRRRAGCYTANRINRNNKAENRKDAVRFDSQFDMRFAP